MKPLLSREQVRHELALCGALSKLIDSGATVCRTMEPAYIDIIGIDQNGSLFFVEAKGGRMVSYSRNEKRFHAICHRLGVKVLLYYKGKFATV